MVKLAAHRVDNAIDALEHLGQLGGREPGLLAPFFGAAADVEDAGRAAA